MGFTVRLHYCMGELAEWSLGQKDSKTCDSCGMKADEAKEKDCCKDEHRFIKNETEQKVPDEQLQLFQLIAADLPPAFSETRFFNYTSTPQNYPVSNSPPRTKGVDVYILNRTFLI